MGDTIWVDIEGRKSGELPKDNSILLRLDKELTDLAARLQVRPLKDFYARGSGWFARRKWFDPVAALTSVNAIYDRLEKAPGDLQFESTTSRQHWPELLMKELLKCRRSLEAASAAGKKFRLLIVS